MHINTKNVIFAKIRKPKKIYDNLKKRNTFGKLFNISPSEIGSAKVFSQNTFANSPCASERAHKRRYEAVLETVPNINSILSIAQ